jgi:hypothetical protein
MLNYLEYGRLVFLVSLGRRNGGGWMLIVRAIMRSTMFTRGSRRMVMMIMILIHVQGHGDPTSRRV